MENDLISSPKKRDTENIPMYYTILRTYQQIFFQWDS